MNEGELEAALGGYIALLAPKVRNHGIIIAQTGTVALASGEAVALQIEDSNTLAWITVAPSLIATLVKNKSMVLVPGGLVILSAQAANKLQGAGLGLTWQAPIGATVKATWAQRIGDNPNPSATGSDQDGTLNRSHWWLSASIPF